MVARAGVANDGDEEGEPQRDGNGNISIEDNLTGGRGGLPEPEQQEFKGPWALIKPADVVDRTADRWHKLMPFLKSICTA